MVNEYHYEYVLLCFFVCVLSMKIFLLLFLVFLLLRLIVVLRVLPQREAVFPASYRAAAPVAVETDRAQRLQFFLGCQIELLMF